MRAPNTLASTPTLSVSGAPSRLARGGDGFTASGSLCLMKPSNSHSSGRSDAAALDFPRDLSPDPEFTWPAGAATRQKHESRPSGG